MITPAFIEKLVQVLITLPWKVMESSLLEPLRLALLLAAWLPIWVCDFSVNSPIGELAVSMDSVAVAAIEGEYRQR